MKSTIAILVTFMAATCSVVTQDHIPSMENLDNVRTAAVVQERVKRSLPSIIASIINAAIFRGRYGQVFFYYTKAGGNKQASQDFYELTGRKVPVKIKKSKSRSVTEKLLRKDTEGHVTLFMKRKSDTPVILIQDKELIYEIKYSD